MSKKALSVLFLGKADDEHCGKALAFCQDRFSDVTAYLGAWKTPLPQALGTWEGEYIISYLSRWVVPAPVIARARVAAINFHPASPDYPGIGCNNFALYEGAQQYGVTCHHMAATVDTGPIIAVRRFPVLPSDDVASLLARTYDHQLALFHDIAGLLVDGKPLPVSADKWTRKPFTRKQFDDLGRITCAMPREEVARRVRATVFRDWRPTIDVHGFTFELKTRH